MTQRQRIWNHLEKHGSLTPFEAFSELGVTKLATRVSELIRYDGKPIGKVAQKGVNRFGEKTRFMRYVLIDQKRAGGQHEAG